MELKVFDYFDVMCKIKKIEGCIDYNPYIFR